MKLRYLKRVWSFQALLRFPSLSKTETSFNLRVMERSAEAITSWVFYLVYPVSWGLSNLAVGMWTTPTLMWALVNIPSTCSFSVFSSSSLGQFAYTHMLVSTQVWTPEGLSAAVQSSLCAALSASVLCPTNPNCFGLLKYSTTSPQLGEYAGVLLSVCSLETSQPGSWGDLRTRLTWFPVSRITVLHGLFSNI